MQPLCVPSFELRWGLEDSLKESQVGKDDGSLKRFPFFLPQTGMYASGVTQWQWLPNFTTVLLSPHQLKTLMETTMATAHIIFTSSVLYHLFHQPWSSYVDSYANQGLQHFPHRDTASGITPRALDPTSCLSLIKNAPGLCCYYTRWHQVTETVVASQSILRH